MEGAPGGEVTLLVEGWLVVVSVGLYGAFLWIQTLRHSNYFTQLQPHDGTEAVCADHHAHPPVRSIGYHALFLPLTMLPIVLLSKKMALLVDHGLSNLGGPQTLGAFSSRCSCWRRRCRGHQGRPGKKNQPSAPSTLPWARRSRPSGLTIPAVLVIGMVTGKAVELGLSPANIHLLLLTLLVTVVNFSAARTNVLHGIVHLMLFITYLVLIFD